MDSKQQIIDAIRNRDQYTHQHKTTLLRDEIFSKHGALEFPSHGGLLHRSLPQGEPSEFDFFNIESKYIDVIELSDEAAVALFYVEGAFRLKGAEKSTNDFRTRALEVFVREEGKWKVRASHWSPLKGGSGLG